MFCFCGVTLILENRNTQISAPTVNSVRGVKYSVFKWQSNPLTQNDTFTVYCSGDTRVPVSWSNLHPSSSTWETFSLLQTVNTLGCEEVYSHWLLSYRLWTRHKYATLHSFTVKMATPNGQTLVLQMDWRNWTGCSFYGYFVQQMFLLLIHWSS